MICTICLSEIENWLFKGEKLYNICDDCGCIFINNGLDQSNKVGGDKEVERNETQNSDRVRRFIELVGENGIVLDFGCGNGMLVNDCNSGGLNAIGYDKFNSKFWVLPQCKFDLVSMVEVIEHTFESFSEINIIYNLLKDDGILYIETSFTNQIEKPLEDDYINPQLGHCTIFSHKGLDMLMMRKGFMPLSPINDNVRLYKKITDK